MNTELFRKAQGMVDDLILATPTGETRNTLTEINITLLDALGVEETERIPDPWRPRTPKKTRWESFVDLVFGATTTALGAPICPGCGADAVRHYFDVPEWKPKDRWGWRCPHVDEPDHHMPIGSM